MHCWRHGGHGSMLPCCRANFFGVKQVKQLCTDFAIVPHPVAATQLEDILKCIRPESWRAEEEDRRRLGRDTTYLAVWDKFGITWVPFLRGIGRSQAHHRSQHRPVTGQSQASRRPVAGQSQAGRRPVTGPCSSPISDRLDDAQYRMTTTCNIQHETHRSTSTTAHPCPDR